MVVNGYVEVSRARTTKVTRSEKTVPWILDPCTLNFREGAGDIYKGSKSQKNLGGGFNFFYFYPYLGRAPGCGVRTTTAITL